MSSHPNLVHIDDVEGVARASGDLKSTRWRLGAAAGAKRIGLSRWDIAPGARSTPAHSHSDEEEIFYVLSGSGLSWQGGKTYEVAAGDCIVHLAQGEAHTLIAGDQGLSVLVFAEGSATNLTWLPRAQVMWAASHWIPADAEHPYKAELDAGPLELPEQPESERLPTIVAAADVEGDTDEHDGYRGVERNLTGAAGSVASGLRHTVLRPGQCSCPPHWHTTEEEIFVVLGGEGEAVLGDVRLPLRAGSVLARPPATKVAHHLVAGDEGLTYLVYGTRREDDICYYPRSRKLNVLGICFQVDPVDYWTGEEQAPA